MTGSATSDPNAGWLSSTLLDLMAAGQAAAVPCGGRLELAVLALDVSGFTALTERLAASGPAGAERLSEILKARFAGLIEAIVAHGGDITHFAGDAVLAVWRSGAQGGLAAQVLQAAACALAVQALPADASPVPAVGSGLPVRAGVAVGPAWWALLGSEAAQSFVVGGQAVVDAAAVAALGQPGDVMLDAAAGAALVPHAEVEPAAVGPHRALRLRRLHTAASLMAADGVVPRYLPPQLLPHILRGDPAITADWLAEFRRVSVLFATFGDIDFASPEALPAAQSAFCAALSLAQRYGGVLHQLLADGPGATLIIAWGVPSATHEDDARRAATAAQTLDMALRGVGYAPAMGVGTGRVFCGIRGNGLRREWAILGDSMNLAARLMRAAGQGVLCDAETQRAAASRMAFDGHGVLAVKGRSQALPVFRPRLEPAADPAVAIGGERRPVVGRQRELVRLRERLDGYVQAATGGALLLEGEAGIGKSTLLDAMQALAEERGVGVLRGAADAIENATAYFAWRAVLRQLLVARREADAVELREAALAACAHDPALQGRAPLLNDLLALDLPDSAVTAPMEPQGRADALRDLLAGLLRRGAPLLVVLDDAHWFDSASWALAAAVVRRAPGVLFVLATRGMSLPLPPALLQMLQAGAERIALAPLDTTAMLEMVCRRLAVDGLPPDAAGLIADKAQGNPFFSEQLALALRDAGVLRIEGRRCTLALQSRELRELRVPDTVQGVVTGRIDRLAGDEQMTLKVASAIGRSFSLQVLSEVHPIRDQRSGLRGQLDHLAAAELTREERPEPDLSHLFTHVITQQVAYDLMSFAQRRALHRTIAGWFETRHAADLTPYLQLLAHHWSSADELPRALAYLEQAAAQALERYANEEVLRFVGEARALAERAALDVDDQRRSRWFLYEGEALLKLARYSESRRPFESSLKLSGLPVPSTRAGLVLRIAGEAWRQLVRRLVLRRGPSPLSADRPAEQVLQAVHIHQRLAEVGYWEHDILSLVHSAVASLNLAEPVGPTRQLQLAHQVMGFVCGLAGSRRLFMHYRQHADALAAVVDHLETRAFSAQLEAIYFNGQARWDEMHASAQRGGALFERIGERFRWQTCVVLRAWGTLHQGDTAAALALFQEAEHLVGAEGPTQVQVWAAAGVLAVEMEDGQPSTPEAVARLTRLLSHGVDHSDGILCRGLLAQALHRSGQRDAALHHADQAAALIDRLPPASFHTLLGNAAVVDVRLAEWQGRADPGAHKAAQSALRGLRLFALACPIGVPWLWRARAEWARLEGRGAQAAQYRQRARAEAARLGMRGPVAG